MFLDEVIDLPHADAVLTGAGAAHRQRTLHQATVQRLHLRELTRVVRIKNKVQMEIPVADMPDERRERLRGGEILLRVENALGQFRDRHAHIGHERLAARTHRARRVQRVVPRLP